MNTVSRTISGIVACALAIFIVYTTVTEGVEFWAYVWGIAWGVLIGGIGMYLIFNKKEDNIDEIKNLKE